VSLSARDRRALLALAACAVGFTIVAYWPESSAAAEPGFASIPQAENRLARLRRLAASVPGREASLGSVSAVLAQRERGLIVAETAAQAQARLIEILRRVAQAQAPPVEFKNAEPRPPAPFGEHYGEVSAAITFDLRIEQLVNLLADLANQPELVAVTDAQFSSNLSSKEKLINARLVLTGLVPRKLVPEKKALF
jgi:hypothetical protein